MKRFFETQKCSRKDFMGAWGQENRQWYIERVERAISCGDVAVWTLLIDKLKKTSRSKANTKETELTKCT